MFSGIVACDCPVVAASFDGGVGRLSVALPAHLAAGLETGASVCVDGVCLTATRIAPETGQKNCVVDFDIVKSTIARTTLSALGVDSRVNVQRSLAAGDEIGGHEVSGHVDFCATVDSVETLEDSKSIAFSVPPEYIRYIFPRGFMAVNGASLTVSDMDRAAGRFSVWLIPETLRLTNLRLLAAGDKVNIELHRGVQVVVDTIGAAVHDFLAQAMQSGAIGEKEILALSTLQKRLVEG